MNTLENKEKFFAQYHNQKVLKSHKWENDAKDKLFVVSDYEFIEYEYLQLKPLSSVLDEDAIVLGYKHAEHLKECCHFNSDWDNLSREEADYFRLKGYSVPWMGISVEQQIEWGWIKVLKNQSD